MWYLALTFGYLRAGLALDLSELCHLLERYCFADEVIKKHLSALLPGDRAVLRADRAEAFSKLLEISTGEPAIALLQLRTLVTCLADAGMPQTVRTRLVSMAEAHIEELARVTRNEPRSELPATRAMGLENGWPSDAELRRLDHGPYRAVIVGTDYRYRYSNVSNAAFHGAAPSAMVGKPLWETTTPAFFERVTKPVVDRCLAGQPASFVSTHPGRPRSQVHSAHLDPIRDNRGHVVAALSIIRLVDVVEA